MVLDYLHRDPPPRLQRRHGIAHLLAEHYRAETFHEGHLLLFLFLLLHFFRLKLPRIWFFLSQLLGPIVPLVRYGQPEIGCPEEDEIDVRVPKRLHPATTCSTEPPLRLPLPGLPREEQGLLSDYPAEAVRDEDDVVGGAKSGVDGISQSLCFLRDGFLVLERCGRGAVMEGVNGDLAEEGVLVEEVARPEDARSRVRPG